MARGTQLIKLAEMVRNEVGRATSIAVGIDDLPEIKQKLRRQQELFYDDYDWAFLRQIFPVKTLSAGEQYYDFPEGLHSHRIERVVHWYAGLPRDMTRGIDFPEYAIYNSMAVPPVRSDPQQRWDIRWTGTKDQFEVWPVPASNGNTIQFAGIRKLRPLIADSDVCDLDDQMIVLFVAAELLGKQGSENAPVILKLAQARMASIRGRVNGAASERHRLGMGATNDQAGKIRVVVTAR